jgi:vacuolar protein sorting-associated protein 52
LHELNHKINFAKEQSFRDAKACKETNEILDKLKIKVKNKKKKKLETKKK